MFYLFFFMLAPAFSWAAHVLEVGPNQGWVRVSHPANIPWQKAEALCVIQHSQEVACGQVIMTQKDSAVVTIQKIKKTTSHKNIVVTKQHGTFVDMGWDKVQIEVGQEIDAKGNINSNPIQTLPVPKALTLEKKGWPGMGPDPEAQEVDPTGWPKNTTLSRGLASYEALLWETGEHKDQPLNSMTFGIHYIIPHLHFQHAFTRHFATGLQFLYLNYPNAGGLIDGPAGLFTLNWYSDRPFEGFWVQLGGGIARVQAEKNSVEEERQSAIFLATVGGRWVSKQGITLGIGGGVIHLTNSNGNTLPSVPIPGFIPAVTIDMGLAF